MNMPYDERSSNGFSEKECLARKNRLIIVSPKEGRDMRSETTSVS
jgi:hypothetical protein